MVLFRNDINIRSALLPGRGYRRGAEDLERWGIHWDSLHGRVSSWPKKMYIWLTWQQSWAEDSENLPKLRVRYMHTDDSNSNRFNSKTNFIYSSWTAIIVQVSLIDSVNERCVRFCLSNMGSNCFTRFAETISCCMATEPWDEVQFFHVVSETGSFIYFTDIVAIDLVLNIMFRCYTHYFLRVFSWSSNQSIYTFGNPKTSPCRCPTFQGGVKSDVLAALGSVVASAT